jgi:hypothetical protein
MIAHGRGGEMYLRRCAAALFRVDEQKLPMGAALVIIQTQPEEFP